MGNNLDNFSMMGFGHHRNLQDDGEGEEERKLLNLTPPSSFGMMSYGHHRNLRGQPKNANGERNLWIPGTGGRALSPQLFRPDFHRNLQDDGEGEEDRKLFDIDWCWKGLGGGKCRNLRGDGDDEERKLMRTIASWQQLRNYRADGDDEERKLIRTTK